MYPADALIQINLGKHRFIYVQFQAAAVFAFPLGGLFSEWASANRSPCCHARPAI